VQVVRARPRSGTGQAGGGLSGVPLGDDGVVVGAVVPVTLVVDGGVAVVVGGVTVVEAVDAAAGSVVPIGVLDVLDVPEPDSELLTFEVAAVAAPVTFSLMTGAASLACWAVCCTLGLLVTRVAAWRSCS
jgi:hypothetical protein